MISSAVFLCLIAEVTFKLYRRSLAPCNSFSMQLTTCYEVDTGDTDACTGCL